MRGYENEPIVVTRQVKAVAIPAGVEVNLKLGSVGYITQALGGSFTVYIDGNLFRIAGQDADAIGKEPSEDVVAAPQGNLEQQVWDVLRTCYDPEIPVNIVDLGLVYDMRISPEEGDRHVDVKMTLTAQGCGMGTSIAADARSKLLALPGVADANVEIVWDPPWNPQMISPEGRERLGMA